MPLGRKLTRCDYMPRDRKFREVGALDRAPVSFEPCFDQLGAADQVQTIDVAGVVVQQDSVLLHLRRDEDIAMAVPVRELTRQALHPERSRIDVALLDPPLACTAWVPGQNQLRRHTVRASQYPIQTIDRRRKRVLSGLLNAGIRDVLALVFVCVLHTLKGPESQSASPGERPCFLLIGPVRTEWGIEFLAALDRIIERRQFATEKHRIEVAPVPLGLESIFPKDAVSLAPTSRAAVKNLGVRTINEGFLWAVLGTPNDSGSVSLERWLAHTGAPIPQRTSDRSPCGLRAAGRPPLS